MILMWLCSRPWVKIPQTQSNPSQLGDWPASIVGDWSIAWLQLASAMGFLRIRPVACYASQVPQERNLRLPSEPPFKLESTSPSKLQTAVAAVAAAVVAVVAAARTSWRGNSDKLELVQGTGFHPLPLQRELSFPTLGPVHLHQQDAGVGQK